MRKFRAYLLRISSTDYFKYFECMMQQSDVTRLVWFVLHPFPCDNSNTDDKSDIYVQTDEPTQVHSARSSLVVTIPSTNRGGKTISSFIIIVSREIIDLDEFYKLSLESN